MPKQGKNIAKLIVEYARKNGLITESNVSLAKKLNCVVSAVWFSKKRLLRLGILIPVPSGFRLADNYLADDSWQKLLKKRLPKGKAVDKPELLIDEILKQAEANALLANKIVQTCGQIRQKEEAIKTLNNETANEIAAIEARTKTRMDDLLSDIAELKTSLKKLQSGDLDGDKPEYLAALEDFKKAGRVQAVTPVVVVDDRAGGAVLTNEETQAQRVRQRPNQPFSYSGR